ncbi:MAG: NUDIX hydrolase [Acidobacteria bacterium]|nr:MAG: NUDIX hydrolase [Acidobacteriota bacterium]
MPLATTLSRRRAFEGRVISVTVDRVRLPHGPEVDLEVVRHRGSVVLLPMPAASEVILVRQYRYAVDRMLWELPAGSLEAGEDPAAGAARECEEEVGLVPGRVEFVGRFYPTPGFCDEEMSYYRLTELGPPAAGSTAAQDEDEHLEVHRFSVAEVRRMVEAGEITDLKTAFGVTLI